MPIIVDFIFSYKPQQDQIMATYFFAIDETGSFNIFSDLRYSFACGVLMTASQSDINARYKRIFGDNFSLNAIHYFPNSSHPNTICGTDKVDKCIAELVPLATEIYVSNGKPVLASNQQHWWILAIVSVIQGLFENRSFKKGDTINIEVDTRAKKVLGLFEDENAPSTSSGNYHRTIAQRIEQYIAKYRQLYEGIDIKFSFQSDSASIHVNVADIVCGLLRDDNNPAHNIRPIKCLCTDVLSNESPINYIKSNPNVALTLILQRVLANDSKDVSLLPKIFAELAKSKEAYTQAWEEIDSFMQVNLKNRGQENIMPKLAPLQSYFCDEIKINRQDKQNKPLLSTKTRAEIIYRLLGFETHNGAIKPSFSKEYCMDILDKGDEQHLIRKWEIHLKNCYNFAQIEFNGYDFSAVENDFLKLWDIQEKFTGLSFPFSKEKDDSTARITGNLGQALAFQGKLKEALDYYEIAAEKVSKGAGVTYSYMFSVYHRLENIEKCHEYFQKQTGKTAQDFAKGIHEKTDGFTLHSYLRLRALELKLNSKTDLSDDLTKVNSSLGYPFPLVWKWAALNSLLQGDKETAKTYLIKSIKGFREGGFTLQTMALSAVQLLRLTSDDRKYNHEFCRNYSTDLQALLAPSPHFAAFVKANSNLANLDNNLNFWDRAMLLPSYYA